MDFYDDPSKVDEYEQMCQEYDGTELYDVLYKHLTKGSSLLELGSGPGNDIHYLLNNYAVIGSDLSDEFLLRCRKKFKDVPFLKLDAVTIATSDTFDCVFSNKVLHHLSPEALEQSFKRQQQVIEPNGLFAHTFWLGDKEFTMDDMLFVFHDQDRLTDLVSEYFQVLETYPYQEFEEGDSLFIIAKNI